MLGGLALVPRRRLVPLGLALLTTLTALAAPCLAQSPLSSVASVAPLTPLTKDATDPAGQREYVIGPADVLEVAVWNNTLISRTVPVRPDGKISLPILDDVQAAGLTPMQLQSFLTNALAGYIQAPEVAVIVREVHSFKVSVIGQVKTPGRYELTSRVTVLDVLAMAGGLGEYADRGRIVILRRERAITRQIPFAYDKLTAGDGGQSQKNFFVEPDDIILVR
jgi:polysaccharide biosynthesis/export protein